MLPTFFECWSSLTELSSIRTEWLGFRWSDSYGIQYCELRTKISHAKIQIMSKSNGNNRCLTWRRTHIYDYVLLSPKVTVVAVLTDIITVDFMVNVATKFTDVKVVRILTGVHCLQRFCVSVCWHFFVFKSEHNKFGHCCYGYGQDMQKL